MFYPLDYGGIEINWIVLSHCVRSGFGHASNSADREGWFPSLRSVTSFLALLERANRFSSTHPL
jgi:hypothetical protein